MPDVIFKYDLSLAAPTELSLPCAFEVVHVAEQDGCPRLWVRHAAEPGTPRKTQIFEVVGTGRPFGAHASMCGTFFSGAFVWHVIRHHGARP